MGFITQSPYDLQNTHLNPIKQIQINLIYFSLSDSYRLIFNRVKFNGILQGCGKMQYIKYAEIVSNFEEESNLFTEQANGSERGGPLGKHCFQITKFFSSLTLRSQALLLLSWTGL